MTYQVRVSGPSLFGGGGTQYLVEAKSKSFGRKYRLAKSRRSMAAQFANRKTAQTWATRTGGTVIETI